MCRCLGYGNYINKKEQEGAMISLNPRKTDDEIKTFFTNLGYEVSWDHDRNHFEEWWEILKNNKLVCQIDTGIPLSAIIEDFCCFHCGKSKGTSNYDYKISIGNSDNVETKELFRKVYEISTDVVK